MSAAAGVGLLDVRSGAVVDIDADGACQVQAAGLTRSWAAGDVAAAREQTRELLVASARGALAHARVREPGGVFDVEILPDATVRPAALTPRAVSRRSGVLTTHDVSSLSGAPGAASADDPDQVHAIDSVDEDETSEIACADEVEVTAQATDDASRVESVSSPMTAIPGLRSLFEVATCSACGCTDEQGCPQGCWWVAQDLCSRCLPDSAAESEPMAVRDAPVSDDAAAVRWQAIVAPETAAVSVPFAPSSTGRTRRGGRRLLMGAATAAVVISAGWGGYLLWDAAGPGSAVAEAGEVRIDISALARELEAAEAVLADSPEGVEEALIRSLDEAVRAGRGLVLEVAGAEPGTDLNESVAAVTETLRAAVRAVESAGQAKALERASETLVATQRALAGGVEAAELALSETAGRVGDQGVVDDLAGVLSQAADLDAAASSALGTAEEVREISDLTAELAEAVAVVEASAARVREAHGVWLVEQETAQAAAVGSADPAPATTTSPAPSHPSPAPARLTPEVQAQPAPAPAAPAPPPAPVEAGTSSRFELRANPVATSSASPGRAAVQVTVSGSGTSTVVFSIAGRSVTVGTVDGSGTVTGAIEGLPAGSHSWSVTAGGLTATGPAIEVF